MTSRRLTTRPSPFRGGGIPSLYGDMRKIESYLLSLSTPDFEAPSKKEQTAIHEAAHTAVATMIHRGIVDEVFISDTPVDLIDVYNELNITVHGLTGGVRFNSVQITVFENGLIAYSGFFAECQNLFEHGVDLGPLLPKLREQASHDIDRYRALLASEGLSEAEIQNVVLDIGAALKHYFDSGVWEEIGKIADALLSKGHLTGDEVLELVPGFS